MKRPYDLVALIEQESRVNLLESLKDEMSDQKLDAVEQRHKEIDKANGITEEGMTVEKQFFRKDSDCKAAGKPLAEFDLFVSTLIQPDQGMLKGIEPPILKDEYKNYMGNRAMISHTIFLSKKLLSISTAKMRQLVVDRRICCCSQFMIFLLELLVQAIGCLAGPSSSNRKIMN